VVAVATSVLVAGCGSGGSGSDGLGGIATGDLPGATIPAVGAPPAEGPVAPPATGAVPAIEVRDVHTGATVNLASLVPAARPILLWFWAPH
jgi:hypothetical protein